MKKMIMAILAAVAVSGCVNTGDNITDVGACDECMALKSNTRYLCVGMEYSKRFGSCPGCELDAKRLTSLMKNKYGYKGDMLISDQATKSAVVKKLKEGIMATPENGLFLFFYSGHGGQESLGGQEPDGADKMDEYLCLYDSHMLDDEIWAIVSQCKGRVFMYFDACHSATMYRSVGDELKVGNKRRAEALSADKLIKSAGFTFRPEKFVGATALTSEGAKASPRILCWSGCKEKEYSYGGSKGGMLTTAVINNWKKGRSYGTLWYYASKDVNKSEPTQNPVQTYVGGFTVGLEAFK